MRSEKLQAFVLSTVDYGERDRIVSLFTLEHGLIKGFARGARNSHKRFGAALELLARIEIHARLKEGLSTLQQADVISVYPAIRGNLYAIALGLYSAELIELITPEGHPLPRLFRLFSAWLDRLETSMKMETSLKNERRFFEINLLNILGYRPSIEGCSRCGNRYDNRGALLQQNGEIACTQCTKVGIVIDYNTIIALQRCLQTGTFGTISFMPNEITQAGKLLDYAFSTHIARKIKSLVFLHQIEE